MMNMATYSIQMNRNSESLAEATMDEGGFFVLAFRIRADVEKAGSRIHNAEVMTLTGMLAS